MSEQNTQEITLSGQTAIVTGGSRGHGRGIVEALAGAGMRVVAVARNRERLAAVEREVDGVRGVSADVADPIAAGRILQEHTPRVLVLCAGASPLLRPLHHHTWDSFRANWEIDVKATFTWIRDALLMPLPAGSTVIVFSSGAALHGSPLSGGYAGAKATQWMIAKYAREVSASQELGIRFHAVLPRLSPATDLGKAAVAAYASKAGLSADEFSKRFGKPLTPAVMGEHILSLIRDPAYRETLRFQVSGEGLSPMEG